VISLTGKPEPHPQQPALHSRLHPLHVGEGTPMTAVIRIEIERKTPLRFPAEYRNRVAEWALQVAAAPRVSAVQIDFDATASQRDFYRGLLHDLRQGLPRRCRCPGGVCRASGNETGGIDLVCGGLRATLPLFQARIDKERRIITTFGVSMCNTLHICFMVIITQSFIVNVLGDLG
jgi:hypothetical protein